MTRDEFEALKEGDVVTWEKNHTPDKPWHKLLATGADFTWTVKRVFEARANHRTVEIMHSNQKAGPLLMNLEAARAWEVVKK